MTKIRELDESITSQLIGMLELIEQLRTGELVAYVKKCHPQNGRCIGDHSVERLEIMDLEEIARQGAGVAVVLVPPTFTPTVESLSHGGQGLPDESYFLGAYDYDGNPASVNSAVLLAVLFLIRKIQSIHDEEHKERTAMESVVGTLLPLLGLQNGKPGGFSIN